MAAVVSAVTTEEWERGQEPPPAGLPAERELATKTTAGGAAAGGQQYTPLLAGGTPTRSTPHIDQSRSVEPCLGAMHTHDSLFQIPRSGRFEFPAIWFINWLNV